MGAWNTHAGLDSKSWGAIMSIPSRSGFKAAIGSIGDTFGSIPQMPFTYILLALVVGGPNIFFVTEQQAMMAAISAGGEPEIPWLLFAVGLVSLLFLLPLGVGLLRHFTRAEPAYPDGLFLLCLRLIGWTIVLSLAAFAIIMIVAVGIGALSAFSPESPVLPIILFLIFIVVWMWLAVRVTLFYPLIVRGEPSPIRGSFQQTRGWGWFIFRTMFFVFLLLFAVALVSLLIQVSLLGLPAPSFSPNDPAAVQQQMQQLLQPLPLEQTLLISTLSGLIGTLFFAYNAALLGRIFRTIRGID
jgi:hypothetical protein